MSGIEEEGESNGSCFREGNPKHYEIKRAENESSNKLYVKRMVETSAQTSFSPRMHHGKISRRYSDVAYPTTKIRANGVGFLKYLPKKENLYKYKKMRQ